MGSNSNPEKTYNNVVVSLKDWDEAYTLALQENPKLAGEMQVTAKEK